MASTYTNDLRLELIATGEAAATWGDKTNTNLTNIAAAFGYATQDGFAANADATTTVADGSADPARAMYFKVTSSATLTATRTLTIAPNTISRVMWIENATTGGQSIAISQGTGANVTIATGKTAVVYLDGAGSGAAVVDAMAGVSSGASDTLAEILASGNTTGGTDIAVSTGDDITFADSSKAIFGAGSDLQIYHDGSNSYINNVGAGSLIIQDTDGNGDIYIRPKSGQTAIGIYNDNAVEIAHSGNVKLATAATGIDVVGTITADGLDLGDASVINVGTIALDKIKGDADDNTNITFAGSDVTTFTQGGTQRLAVNTTGIDVNGNVSLPDNGKATFGAGDDLQIYHDGSDSFIDDAGTGALAIRSNSINLQKYTGETMAVFTADGSSDLYHNNAAKLATTSTGIQVTGDIANASGDLTLDVAGRIILDADTDGNVRFSNSGILYGQIFQSTDMYIRSVVADKDLIFQGNDNGTNITALTLDMSNAGAATFNSSLTIPDFIYHAGDTHTYFGFQGGDQFELDTGGANRMRVVGSEVAFNDDGGDKDFRVESDGNSHMLFVDGGNDAAFFGGSDKRGFVNIETTAVNYSSGVFDSPHIALQASSQPDDNDGFVGITYATSDSDNYGWSAGAERTSSGVGDFVFTEHNNSATGSEKLRITQSGAATFSSSVTAQNGIFTQTGGDFAATFSTPFDYISKFVSTDSAGFIVLQDVNSTDNANRIGVVGDSLQIEAGNVENVAFTSAGPTFNEAGADLDFRVESDTHAHAIFLDAGNSRVGINESAPDQALTVNGTIQAVNSNVTMIDASASATVLTPPRGYSYINVSRSDTTAYGLLLLVFRTSSVLSIVSTVDNRASSKYSASTSGTGLVVTNDDSSQRGFYASCVSIGFGTGD